MSVTFPSTVSKEQVLIALWAHTRAVGIGLLSRHSPTESDATTQLERDQYVDYFEGRPIKVSFKEWPILESLLYDRDAGQGTMNAIANSFDQAVPP